MKTLILILISLIITTISLGQSIRINEFSQGVSGAKEWVELVVSSASSINNTNCVLAKVNIAGWILDDNNGDYSPINHFTGSGVATGHMRFKNEAPWNNLPVGAIIVIYNALDKDLILPADDPYDWVNNDCIYIVPSNHVSLEYCTTLPVASSCILRTDYTSCSYTSTGTWVNIGLANAGDAIQIRDPSFNLVHGLVYGRATSASGCTTTDPMIGNALAPIVSSTSMSAVAASFIGTTDADYFDATKWTIVAASLATPGAFNNSDNQTYIVNTLRGGCTCNRILPLNNVEGNNITIVRDLNKLELSINGGLLKSNYGSLNYIKHIRIYSIIGDVKYDEIIFARRLNTTDLNPYFKRGVNIIEVIIVANAPERFIFKYIK